jgi:hypothetical protein
MFHVLAELAILIHYPKCCDRNYILAAENYPIYTMCTLARSTSLSPLPPYVLLTLC